MTIGAPPDRAYGPVRDNQTCVSGMAAGALPLRDELALYQRIGVDLAGLAWHKIAAYGRKAAVAEIAGSGVRLGYLVQPFVADPDDVDGRAGELQQFIAAIDTAAELGAPRVYFTSGRSGSYSWEQAAAKFCALLEPAVAHAKDVGIALAVENTLPVRCDLSFTHTARDAFTLARMLEIGICLDFYCCWQESGLANSLRDNLELIELVQVSDFVVGTNSFPNRWVPGDGDLPMERLLQDLLALGYSGIVDLELNGPEVHRQGPETALRRGVDWMNRQLGR